MPPPAQISTFPCEWIFCTEAESIAMVALVCAMNVPLDWMSITPTESRSTSLSVQRLTPGPPTEEPIWSSVVENGTFTDNSCAVISTSWVRAPKPRPVYHSPAPSC
ncbi:MAG: hypothetical protein IPN17_28640 [Deltaproteobacteria bacterium]|nr:hypothetical protein [Deltaproteobacteria bacterium]